MELRGGTNEREGRVFGKEVTKRDVVVVFM
jgi:hypothetical protein